MPFAQLVIGPPGAGKSTYCDGMHQFMSAIGRRCSVVNLDPANDQTSYKAAIDVRNLISLENIMGSEELGPNGGVLYALEELEHNFQWLENGLKELGDDYILFDCPGQVELFTHHSSLRNIFFRLQKLGYRLVVIHLIDSYVLTQPSLYISALLLALRSMLQMDLPHLNVLTKVDNLANYPPLLFNLDFYTEVHDLQYLLPHLDLERSGAPPPSTTPTEPTESKFSALNRAIVDLIQDFSLVSFETLAVEDKNSMTNLLRVIDRASGYAFGADRAGANDTMWQVAMREGYTSMDVRDVQERWVDRREEFDEGERRRWEEEGRAFREGRGEGEQAVKGGNSEEMEGIEEVGKGEDVVRDAKTAVDMSLPEIRRGMMGRDGLDGVKVLRKSPPEVKSEGTK